MPWRGNLADMPEGFALCDGSNGTPDLRDRFIVGAGTEYTLMIPVAKKKYCLKLSKLQAITIILVGTVQIILVIFYHMVIANLRNFHHCHHLFMRKNGMVLMVATGLQHAAVKIWLQALQ